MSASQVAENNFFSGVGPVSVFSPKRLVSCRRTVQTVMQVFYKAVIRFIKYRGVNTSVCGCRRDYETRPLKMSLLAEIRAHPHRNEPSWVPEPESPIDYCYVRPNHIPSVNSMCQDMFWPGKIFGSSAENIVCCRLHVCIW